MANPLKGELEFVQDGSTYVLVLDVNALCAAEHLLNLKAQQISHALATGGHMSVLRGLLWAGLKRHHDLTLEEAGRLLQAIGLERATQLMDEALRLSFPDPKKDAKPNPRKAARGTGPRSTATG